MPFRKLRLRRHHYPAGWTLTLAIPSGAEPATGEDPLVGDLDILESVFIVGAGIAQSVRIAQVEKAAE